MGTDLWIEGSQGDNICGGLGTGGGGSSNKGIPAGTNKSLTFAIGLQNEGNTADYYDLSWDTPAGWRTEIQHQDGSIVGVCDNTLGSTPSCTRTVPLSDTPCPSFSDMNSNNQFEPGVDQCLVNPGEVLFLKLVITIPNSFTTGDRSIIINGQSRTDPASFDSIRARVWANALNITSCQTTPTTAILQWNTPSWSANGYDLRYSAKEIVEDGLPLDGTNCSDTTNCVNFSNVAPLQQIPFRNQDGSVVTQAAVSQLYAGKLYYFALKTKSDANYTSVISTSSCSTGPSAVSPPPSATYLEVTDSTADSVTLCWIAPGRDDGPSGAFLDHFSDETVEPWSQLQNGAVTVVNDPWTAVNDPTDGWILRKSTNIDPSGGWAQLVQPVSDFELTLYTRRVTSVPPANYNRYSLTDGSGNGYGFFLGFNFGNLQTERRTNWNPTLLGTEVTVSGGLSVNKWYTARFKRVGSSLTLDVYNGRVNPDTTLPIATATTTDSAYLSFTQVNVNGGYVYDTDDMRVITLSGGDGSNPATGYDLRYSTKYIVDGVTPGIGETAFNNSTRVDGLGRPKSPGSDECSRVKVQNILAGNDGIMGTPDDIDRTPNTQFFFALKSEDEREAQGQSLMSNAAKGLTAMFSSAYNMVSVPKESCLDANGQYVPCSPTGAFGDDVGSDLYLYSWRSSGLNSKDGCYDWFEASPNINYAKPPACTSISTVDPGKGYFLWSPALNINLDADGAAACESFPLPPSCAIDNGQTYSILSLRYGWNVTGNPFGKEVNVSSVKIQSPDGTTTKTFQNAAATGWVEGAIYTHNGVNNTDEICNDIQCDALLQPWKGYWIWNKIGDGYKLLIPKP